MAARPYVAGHEAPASIADLAAVVAASRQNRGAAINRAFTTNNATAPTSVTAGMALNYAAVLTTAKVSGIYDVSISVAWSGATTGDTGTFAMTTQHAATAITLANNTAVGVGCQVSSAAGGITATGGAGSTQQFSMAVKALTGVLQGVFTWRGLVMNSVSATTPTGFTLGDNVVFLFSLNATNSWTLGAVTMVVQEVVS